MGTLPTIDYTKAAHHGVVNVVLQEDPQNDSSSRPDWVSYFVMKPGANEVYEFKIDGNTLTLTQRRNVRGPVERGTVWTLTRVE